MAKRYRDRSLARKRMALSVVVKIVQGYEGPFTMWLGDLAVLFD